MEELVNLGQYRIWFFYNEKEHSYTVKLELFSKKDEIWENVSFSTLTILEKELIENMIEERLEGR